MVQSRSLRPYGYKRFTPQEYDFTNDAGLKAGDQYQDVELSTLDGKKVHLSDYMKGKPLVLETGSMTCPMYAQSTAPMQTLIQKNPQLDYLLLYVREAHPGERRPQHSSIEDKLDAAAQTRRRYSEYSRPILVDSIDGAAHQFYGAMPNSIFIIAPNGKIVFRSIWNNTKEIESILASLSRGENITSRELKAIPPFSLRGVRTLFYGGGIALWDFVRGLPRLIANHKKVGNM
jgi:hypothetical protein